MPDTDAGRAEEPQDDLEDKSICPDGALRPARAVVYALLIAGCFWIILAAIWLL